MTQGGYFIYLVTITESANVAVAHIPVFFLLFSRRSRLPTRYFSITLLLHLVCYWMPLSHPAIECPLPSTNETAFPATRMSLVARLLFPLTPHGSKPSSLVTSGLAPHWRARVVFQQKADILAGRRIFVNNYLAEHRRISVQSGGSSLPALSPVSHQSDE